MLQLRNEAGSIIKGYATIDYKGFKITMATDDSGCRIYRCGALDERQESVEAAIFRINEWIKLQDRNSNDGTFSM